MKELPLYNGEAPQTPQVQVQKPGEIPALPMWGQNVDAAINAVGDALVKYGELEDYGTAAEIGRKRKELAARANRDFTEKARLPWGAEGSFYNEDGTRNEDEIRAFAAKWEEENEKLGTGRFWLRKNALRAAEEKEDFSVGFALEVDKNILKGEQENRERLFRDNYDLCLAKEDYAGGAAEVDKAVEGGMITKARGEAMKIRLAKRGVGGGGGVRVGGESYEEFEAQLAAGKAREEGEKSPDVGGTKDDVGFEDSALAAREEGSVGLRLDANYWGNEGDGGDKSQEEAKGEREITLRPWEEWAQTGECGGVIRLMTEAEYEGLQLNLAGQAEMVRRETDALGDFHWSAGESAPEVAQVAVAGANKRGAMSNDEARAMVTGILLDKFKTYGGLSEDAAAQIFKDSGVYDILGDGNENMGVAEVKGIADEVKKRVADTGLKHLDENGIETLVDKQLDTMDYGTDKNGKRADWARMEDIAAKLNADSGYVKKGKWYRNDQQGAARQDFYFALEMYRKHRWEYNPESEGGDLRKEFEGKAVGFVNWWNVKYGKAQKKVAREVQKNYLIGEIHNQLGRRATEDGYGKEGENYVRDVQIARRVIETTAHAPLSDAVDAYLKQQEQQEKNTEEIIKAQQQQSAEAYKKLNEVMEAKAEEEAAAKEQEAKEKKEQKKREKEEEKAAAAAEAEAARRKRIQQALARRQPVAQSWTWDGVARGKSGALVCKLPKKELQRIKSDMGYDGGQFVILKMGNSSKSIYVDMEHAAKGEAIELSSAAVKLMQEKPTGRGRKRVVPAVKSSGQGDFYYEFKEIK